MKTILKGLLKIIIFAIIITAVVVGIYIFLEYQEFKEFRNSSEWNERLEKARDKENYANFSELPERYIDAVISVEDKRYYNHVGLDLKSIGRAIYNNFKKKDLVEGGSTITQQLAKNIFYTQDTSVSRKINEMFAAIELELEFSKEEIFEMYVNNAYYGSGYYTLKEAAKGYFNKNLDELDLNQITFLAGVPNAPSIYDPRENPDLAKQRQIQVLKKMVLNKKMTIEERKKIEKQEIKVIE